MKQKQNKTIYIYIYIYTHTYIYIYICIYIYMYMQTFAYPIRRAHLRLHWVHCRVSNDTGLECVNLPGPIGLLNANAARTSICTATFEIYPEIFCHALYAYGLACCFEWRGELCLCKTQSDLALTRKSQLDGMRPCHARSSCRAFPAFHIPCPIWIGESRAVTNGNDPAEDLNCSGADLTYIRQPF